MDTHLRICRLNYIVLFSFAEHVTSAKYCTVYCENGCGKHGCDADNVAIVLGSVAGGIGAILLGAAIAVLCMGHMRKKLKKDKVKEAMMVTEREIMKENEIRTIKMDCQICKLIIMRNNRKKITVHVGLTGTLAILKDEDIRVSGLSNDRPPIPRPAPQNLLNRNVVQSSDVNEN